MKNEMKGDWGVKNEMEGNEEQSEREVHHEVEGKVKNEVEGKYNTKWEGMYEKKINRK